MVLSEDVQRAAFEGDLETITAWMASNDVNDTVVAPAARCPCCRILERVLKHALLPAAREASRPRESRPRDHGGQAACLVVRAAAPALSHRPLVLASLTVFYPSWFFSPRIR